ncbi:MAG: hypothetical protein HZB40_21110 [Rhodocyclales bacterium]|nr:hypothetical protein [Rhodocyclales bacterium]
MTRDDIAVTEGLPAAAAEAPAGQKSAPAVRRCVAYEEGCTVDADDLLFDAPGVEAVAALCAGIVVDAGDEQRVATLLAAGADCVFVGAAAVEDSAVVDRLAKAHGAERIGVYARLGRQSVSWSFETVSNADFKTVTPSHCEPAWEVLRADGSGSGALASWWLKAMRELGATRFLVQVDICDDTDLNLCAGLVDELGDALWIGPLVQPAPRLAEWVGYGQCRQLVLPPTVYARRADLLAATPAA